MAMIPIQYEHAPLRVRCTLQWLLLAICFHTTMQHL